MPALGAVDDQAGPELRESDLRRALEFVHEIGAADGLEQLQLGLVDGLATMIPCDLSMLGRLDPVAGRAMAVGRPQGVVDAEGALGFQRHFHQDPTVAHQIRTGHLGALKVSDFLGTRAWARTDVYDAFFRRVDVRHTLSLRLAVPVELACAVLHRDRPDFSERERQLLGVLAPHIAQSWRNALTRERLAALDAGGGGLPPGVAVVNALDRIESLTPRAAAVLAVVCGRRLGTGSPLPSPLAEWLRDQRGRANGAERPNPLEPLTLETPQGSVRVRVLRHAPADTTVVFEESGNGIDAGALRAAGLTRRETQVLTLVANGLTNDAIALELTISPRTVHKHLQRVFEKLRVGTRTAAAAKAAELSRLAAFR